MTSAQELACVQRGGGGCTQATQEPNIMAPHAVSSLFLLEKMENKTNRSSIISFGTKSFKFCFKIISFSSLESELSFDSENSEINFDRARSTTMSSPLTSLRAICKISSDDREAFFADELLAY